MSSSTGAATGVAFGGWKLATGAVSAATATGAAGGVVAAAVGIEGTGGLAGAAEGAARVTGVGAGAEVTAEGIAVTVGGTPVVMASAAAVTGPEYWSWYSLVGLKPGVRDGFSPEDCMTIVAPPFG